MISKKVVENINGKQFLNIDTLYIHSHSFSEQHSEEGAITSLILWIRKQSTKQLCHLPHVAQ